MNLYTNVMVVKVLKNISNVVDRMNAQVRWNAIPLLRVSTIKRVKIRSNFYEPLIRVI